MSTQLSAHSHSLLSFLCRLLSLSLSPPFHASSFSLSLSPCPSAPLSFPFSLLPLFPFLPPSRCSESESFLFSPFPPLHPRFSPTLSLSLSPATSSLSQPPSLPRPPARSLSLRLARPALSGSARARRAPAVEVAPLRVDNVLRLRRSGENSDGLQSRGGRREQRGTRKGGWGGASGGSGARVGCEGAENGGVRRGG